MQQDYLKVSGTTTIKKYMKTKINVEFVEVAY